MELSDEKVEVIEDLFERANEVNLRNGEDFVLDVYDKYHETGFLTDNQIAALEKVIRRAELEDENRFVDVNDL